MKKARTYTVISEVDPSPKKRGVHSIYIRITSKGERIRIGTGLTVNPKNWDAQNCLVKGTPIASTQNTLIKSQITKCEKFIYEKQIAGIEPQLKDIKSFMLGESTQSTTISSYISKLKQQMAGKFAPGTLRNYEVEANRLDKYHMGVTFDMVDNTWLKDYELHNRKQGYKHNTIQKIQKMLVKFFNSAIKDGVTGNNPFKTFEKVKYRQTDRTYLTWDEIGSIEEKLLLPMDDRIRRAAVWFLFGCYTGLRYSDWRRFSPAMVHGKDIVLRAKKNGQLVIMPIHSKLAKVIEMTKEVGPVEVEQNTNILLKDMAGLCNINKHITCHVSRHSFAVRCAELGISIETTAELLGVNVKTCAIYYKVTGDKVRKEMAKWG